MEIVPGTQITIIPSTWKKRSFSCLVSLFMVFFLLGLLCRFHTLATRPRVPRKHSTMWTAGRIPRLSRACRQFFCGCACRRKLTSVLTVNVCPCLTLLGVSGGSSCLNHESILPHLGESRLCSSTMCSSWNQQNHCPVPSLCLANGTQLQFEELNTDIFGCY